MIDINEKLNTKYLLQKDGSQNTDEENRLCQVASAYALAEGAIAVLSCLRTNISHIYFGKVAETIGFDSFAGYQKVDSVWEEEIIERIHPDDWAMCSLQELLFYRLSSLQSQPACVYPFHLEHTMRMADGKGKWHNMLHRIFYFVSKGKLGISYVLCIYRVAGGLYQGAHMINTLTGEDKVLKVDDCRRLLSEREKNILVLIRMGLASKKIAARLEISKHTVDRHRQNIISKLQVNNATEACHKAKLLGLIE